MIAVHPRHTTIRRSLVAIAAALALCSVRAAQSDFHFSSQRTLDSLFYAGRYDTLRVLLPSLIRVAEVRGDSAALGRLAFHRGRVELTLGHQAVASRELDRAIRLTEAARDTIGLLPALNFKAFVLRDQSHVDEAMALFERERDLAQRARNYSGEANATFNLAYRDLRRGDLQSARTGYLQAMELFRLTGDPYQVAIGCNALGNLYLKLDDADSSRYWFEQTLRISREHHYPFHELWALNNMGLLEGNVGNYENSLECYKAALAIGRRIGFDRGTALPAMNLALAYSYMGQRDLAFQSLEECIEVSRRAGFKDLEVNNTIAAGLLNLEAGRSNQAATYFRRILNRDYVYETLRRTQAAAGMSLALAQMDSVSQALAVLEPYVSPRAQVTDHIEQPYFELTYIELLRRAHRCGEALDRVEPLRQQLDRDGRTDLSVSARLIESACRRQTGDPSLAAGVLSIALDSLEVVREEVGHADIREAYSLHVMDDVIEGCRVLLEYPPDAPHASRVRVFYDALQRFKTRTLIERIHDPRGGGNPLSSQALTRQITADRVQQDVLQPGELLLDIVAGAEAAYLFAVTPDSCRLVPLPGRRSRLADQVGLYSELISAPSRRVRDAYGSDRLAEAQRSLGRAILEPVSDLVARADRIIVAPDAFFAAIPFGTLVLDEEHMLMETKDVIEVPSASVLQWARQQRGGARVAQSIVIVAAVDDRELAGAQREVKTLERRYAGVQRLDARPGVLDSLVSRARDDRILHVTAHARVNDESPWQSGFLLETASLPGGGSAPTGESVLRAWEIARARLPFDVAVLAGCETARGRATGGEGVLGLTSAFLSAGAPVVVSSRWAVDDQVTATLMEHFYDRLAAGDDVGAALRGAQLAVRSDRRTRHPFYWAGFAVVGDGSRTVPLALPGRHGAIWFRALAGAGAIAGLAAMAVLIRRRRHPSPAV